MMTAALHSNGQQRTQKDGDTEEGCQNCRNLLNWFTGCVSMLSTMVLRQ